MADVIALVALALFLMTLGGLVVIAREIRREDRYLSLAGDAPSLMSRHARRINGFGRGDPELKFSPPSGELLRSSRWH